LKRIVWEAQHTSFFVCSIRLAGLAVNLGGNCGGFLYCAGAILLLSPNASPNGGAEVEKGTLFHLMYWVMEGTRAPRRIDVRTAEEAMIRARATSRTRDEREREEATVVVGGVVV
jgi:hypothetical protein